MGAGAEKFELLFKEPRRVGSMLMLKDISTSSEGFGFELPCVGETAFQRPRMCCGDQ